MATIQLYRDVNYSGRLLEVKESIENLNNEAFNDQASSCRIADGTWLLYKDVNFQGECSILSRGNYSNAQAMDLPNDSLSSLRPLPQIDGPTILLFKDTNYRGRMVIVHGADSDLRSLDFNDQVSSIIVLNGTWSLYKDISFSGATWQVKTDGSKPGYYPDPSSFQNDTISSLKPI